ncbi:unnamed protein product [Brassica oleracea var. botrytis]
MKAWVYASPQKKIKKTPQTMKAIDRRKILGPEDCLEGDPKGQAGEAGLTKTRSGYRPKGSTPDAEAPPEIDIAVTWEPSTENRCQQLTNGVRNARGSKQRFKALDTGPFPQAEDSKDFRHQNKAEAEYNYDFNSRNAKDGVECVVNIGFTPVASTRGLSRTLLVLYAELELCSPVEPAAVTQELNFGNLTS